MIALMLSLGSMELASSLDGDGADANRRSTIEASAAATTTSGMPFRSQTSASGNLRLQQVSRPNRCNTGSAAGARASKSSIDSVDDVFGAAGLVTIVPTVWIGTEHA